MLDSNFKDKTSLFKSPHIHFHNGLLKKAPAGQNQKGLWYLNAWPDLKEDFPVYSWIQSQLAKNQVKDIAKRDRHLSQTHPSLQKALPVSGYALFVPKTQASNVSLKNLKTQSHTSSLILHIHFSFDESYGGEGPLNLASSRPVRWGMKNFIFLEKGAKITLIESFDLPVTFQQAIPFTTAVESEPYSSLNWLNMNVGKEKATLSCDTHCEIKSHASIHRLSLALNEGSAKDFVTVHHAEEGARSVLLGLSLLQQKAYREERWDTKIEAKEVYCRQYFKSILSGLAKSVFHGKVYISPKSFHTDCAQSAKSVLLSRRAFALVRPEMEVHCGEVKARHGATTGQLNLDEMFYLQSRGLQKTEVFEMLLMAHIKNILSLFPEKQIREQLLWDLQKNHLPLLTKNELVL